MRKKHAFKWTFYDRQDETGDFIAFLARETGTETTGRRDERHQLKFRTYNGKIYVIKRFSPSDHKKIGRRIDLAIRSLLVSGAEKSFRGAAWLWEAKIPVIRPVAFSAKGRGISRVSYFVYEAIAAEKDVNAFIADMEADDPRKPLLIGEMARITRKIHDAGYRYTDIVGHNFLVDTADASGARLYLIDTDKTQKTFFTAGVAPLKLFFDMRCLRRLRLDNDSIRHFLRVYHGRELKKSDLMLFSFWISGGFDLRKRAALKKRLPAKLRKIHREPV